MPESRQTQTSATSGARLELQGPLHPTERADREALTRWQERRLRELLSIVRERNPFYARRLAALDVDVAALRLPDDLVRLPMTTKAELMADQEANPPWGSALT